jgi:hypothetical protein
MAVTLLPEGSPVFATASPDVEDLPATPDTIDAAGSGCGMSYPTAEWQGTFNQSTGQATGTWEFGAVAECEMRMRSIWLEVELHNHSNGDGELTYDGCSNEYVADRPCKSAVVLDTYSCSWCNGGWQAHADASFRLKRGLRWTTWPDGCGVEPDDPRMLGCGTKTRTERIPPQDLGSPVE